MSDRTNSTGKKNFDVAEVIADNLLVTMDDKDTVSIAGVGDYAIGSMMRQAFAIGENCGVNLRSKPGTVTLVSADTFAAGAELFGVAGGKVSDTNPGSALAIGIAHEPATAADQYIEVEFYGS